MANPRRELLNQEFKDILGSENVYYQPPESQSMEYPCIRYETTSGYNPKADNKSYLWVDCYNVQYIHKDPDDEMTAKIRNHFEKCSQGSRYKADNLYHDIFTLYY